MGMSESKQTTQNQVGAMSPQMQQMMQLVMQMAQGSAGQMGDLSALARGDMAISEQDRQLVSDAQSASGDIARRQMEQAMQEAMRGVEGQMLGRGLEGSSIEAVNNALIGQDFQRQMANMLGQQRAESAQQLMNMPFQRAGVQLNANQLLMQRLLGGAQPMMSYDAAMRQGSGTQTTTSQVPLGQMLMQAGTQLGSARLSQA